MRTSDGVKRTVTLEEAGEQTVGLVMIRRPKTLPADARVADVRRSFERPGVRTVLLADDRRFVGAIERGGLPAGAADDEPASRYIEAAPLTATPGLPMSEAIELIRQGSEPRLIVLDEDGTTLLGLLCANSSMSGFCLR